MSWGPIFDFLKGGMDISTNPYPSQFPQCGCNMTSCLILLSFPPVLMDLSLNCDLEYMALSCFVLGIYHKEVSTDENCK